MSVDPLLRAAVDRRDREQAVYVRDELELLDADEERLQILTRICGTKCRGCGGKINDTNKTGYCSGKRECVNAGNRVAAQRLASISKRANG